MENQKKRIRQNHFLILLFSTIIFAISALVNIHFAKIDVEKIAIERGRQIVIDQAHQLEREFSSLQKSLHLIAANFSRYSNWPKAKRRETILGLLEVTLEKHEMANGIFTQWEPGFPDNQTASNAFFSDESGGFIPYCIRLPDGTASFTYLTDLDSPKVLEAYNFARQTGQDFLMPPYFYLIGKEQVEMTTIVTPIPGEIFRPGVVGADISLKSILKKVSKLRLFKTGYGYLLSNQAKLISHPNHSLVGKTLTEVNSSLTKEQDAVIKGQSYYGEGTSITDKGKKVLRFFQPLKLSDTENFLVLGATIPMSEILEDIKPVKLFSWLTFFIALVMVAAAFYFGVSSTNSIKSAIAERIELELRFKAIFNSSFQFMGILNPDGILLEANETSLNAIGEKKSNVIGKPFWETPWWPRDSKAKEILIDSIQRAAKGETIRFEAAHQTKTSKQLLMDFSLKPIFDENGKVSLIIPEGRDISDYKSATAALEESEKKYRSLFESSKDAIMTIHPPNWNIETGNKALLEMFEIPNKELLKQHSPASLSPETQPDGALSANKCLKYLKIASETGSCFFEWEHKKLNGACFSCTVLLTRVGTIKNHFIQATLRDISEQLKSQKEREELLAQLNRKETMESLGQLAGGVAHDLNNMLGGVMGATELLQLHLSDNPKAQEYIDMILKSTERGAELIKNLLAFARKGKLIYSPVNVHLAIQEAVRLLNRTIDKRIKIEIALDSAKSIVIGDLSQLQSAILNLGVNSSHAMPDGGVLGFSTREVFLDSIYCEANPFKIDPGNYIEIEIRDTGSGIPQENLNKIFEPFFTTKETEKGTGLGLAAVHGMIEQHKGALNVYSEIGKGTVFHLMLPLTEDMELFSKPEDEVVMGKGLILLIDDEEMIRATAAIILKRLGYDVMLARDGKKGLELFKFNKEKIDLVILDMVMPEMNGITCFEKIKEIEPKAKVIMSSGFSSDENVEALLAQGLNAFIKKPYTTGRLSKSVASVLGEDSTKKSLEKPTGNDSLAEARAEKLKVVSNSKKILVMDDQEVIQMLLTNMLSFFGYSAECASDGEQALNMFKRESMTDEPYAMVITDLKVLKGMSGYELAEKLRSFDPDVKIIAASGDENDPIMTDPVHHGFAGKLSKPFYTQALQDVLRANLGSDSYSEP